PQAGTRAQHRATPQCTAVSDPGLVRGAAPCVRTGVALRGGALRGRARPDAVIRVLPVDTVGQARPSSAPQCRPDVRPRRAAPRLAAAAMQPRRTDAPPGPGPGHAGRLAAVAVLVLATALGARAQRPPPPPPVSQVPSIVVLYSQSAASQTSQAPLTVTHGGHRQNLVVSEAARPGPAQHGAGHAGAAGPAGRTAAGAAPPQVPQGAASAAQGDVLMRGRSPTPRCAQGQPFCLYDQDYPQERVHDILNTYHDDANTLYHALHRYSPQELINRDNQTHNYRHRGHFACESEVAYLRPGWARNWKDQWVAVVNTDKFPQMVRVETCKFLNQKCEFLPPCYKSSCVQRFAATRLLCVDPANPHQRPIIEVFEMPVACSCFVENFRFL
ncbi:Neurotrophin 1, partial [Frankliniella fusca]